MWTVMICGSEGKGVEWSVPADTREKAIQYAEWFFGNEDLGRQLKGPSDSASAGDCILAMMSPELISAIQSGEVPEVCPVPTDSDYFVLKESPLVTSQVV
jgi:hypothetical protein